jgi:LacI family transcriptional regulator, galactose operon repressor
MAGKVTLTDVATAAGVSLATVDRVINRRGGVAARREERVLRAARDLGLDRQSLVPPTRIKRIAVFIQSPANPFHAELAAGIAVLRPAFQALNLQLQIHHIDPNSPERLAALVLKQKDSADGIIISGPDTPEVAAALHKAAQALPVVTLATDIAASGRAAYIGPDDTRAGRVAGDLIGRLMGAAGGDVLMIAGRLDIAGQRARAKGLSDILARYYPHASLVRIVETGEDRAVTATHVRAALRSYPRLRAIYHTTAGASGIAEALEAQGRLGEIVVVTHELTPNRRRHLRDRTFDAVIDQNPRHEVRIALETMARLLGRMEGDAGSVSTEIRIHMPENA